MHKSLLLAFVVTAIILGLSLYPLLRRRRRHPIPLTIRILGTIGILIGAGGVFAGMTYVGLEYIFNIGPDDLGAPKFAKSAVENQTGVPVKQAHIVVYQAEQSTYVVGYLQTDGRLGIAYCQYDEASNQFTNAVVRPVPPQQQQQ